MRLFDYDDWKSFGCFNETYYTKLNPDQPTPDTKKLGVIRFEMQGKKPLIPVFYPYLDFVKNFNFEDVQI